MAKFYSCEKIWNTLDVDGQKPAVTIVCSRVRGPGKTYSFCKKFLDLIFESEFAQKIAFLCRTQSEVGSVAEGALKSVMLDHYPAWEVCEKKKMGGAYSEVWIRALIPGYAEEGEKEEYEEKLKILLLPKDPNDDKNIILEIRGAAGGDEAQLFAGDLLQMYQKYAESQGWRFEVMEASYNGVGGIKEVVAMVSGQSVYSKLKYESGAHRVQRVPVTESQGRVHTSTATVLVMPEVEEVEYDIDPKDLRVDIYHASGAGGQNVNKVATAVRIVHLPTNIKVEMQEERTQQKNRDKAMKIIRARVADHFAQIAQDEQDAERKSTIGTGDRSERIRTYNFPQNRVTDHRIGLTLQKLDTILAGKLDEVVDALVLYDQTQKLEELNK